MRERVLPILEAAGVDLVLGGHSHAYERSYLIDGHYDSSATFGLEMIKDGVVAEQSQVPTKNPSGQLMGEPWMSFRGRRRWLTR